MLALAVFILGVYGLANAFTLKIGQFFFGKQKSEQRKGLGRIPYLGDLFYCVPCLAFWIGIAASLWILSPAAIVCPVRWKAVVLDGCLACGTSWILFAWSERQIHGIDEI